MTVSDTFRRTLTRLDEYVFTMVGKFGVMVLYF